MRNSNKNLTVCTSWHYHDPWTQRSSSTHKRSLKSNPLQHFTNILACYTQNLAKLEWLFLKIIHYIPKNNCYLCWISNMLNWKYPKNGKGYVITKTKSRSLEEGDVIFYHPPSEVIAMCCSIFWQICSNYFSFIALLVLSSSSYNTAYYDFNNSKIRLV